MSRSRRLPFVIFFLSGASGLAYEVVWTRLLGLAVGHTTVALTAVVAAFMGGLAGGSAVFGRRLERGADPVYLYAKLEAGIALLALLFPVQLAIVTSLSASTARVFDGGPLALGLVRFLLAGLAVAPAAFLMGGTMPAMIAAMSSGRGPNARPIAHHAGLLYAVNTAGAVVGAALAGFILIERVGTLETTWLAAAGNMLAAVMVYALMGSRERRVDAPAPVSPVGERHAEAVRCDRVTLGAYAAAGFAALALQVVWTRVLVFFAGSTTYAFTSILIVFLSGITIGSAAAAPFVDRLRRPAAAFAIVQVLLGLSAAWSIRLLRLAAPMIDAAWPPDETWLSLVSGNFAKAAITTGVPTLLMGIAFPMAVRLVRGSGGDAGTGARTRHSDEDERRMSGAVLGRLYAANTAGGILGAALTGLLLVPLLGVTTTLIVVALVSVGAGLTMVWRDALDRRAPVVIGVASVLAIVGGADRTALHVPVGSERLVFYEEGSSATISVLEEVTGTRTIYIDRVPVAGTDAIMLTDQKSLAHVPMLLHPGARRVLTVGFGSGGASWSFARYSGLERVDAVEIDPSVFHAAPHLDASNHGIWRDPRFRLIIEDARSYLASTDATYDVIATDCTDLRYKSNANLYTVDYFALVRQRLNPGGLVTVWMPLGGLGGDTFRMALRTFRDVFPHSTVWYMTNQPTHYLLLVGSDRVIQPDVDMIAKAITAPGVREDLAEIRLDDPLKLAASLLLDERELARLAGEGPLNTDRHPLLEFQAPRLAYRDSLATNLRATLAALDSRSPAAEKWRATEVQRASLAPYLAATPALIEGHARYQLGTFDYAGALRLYRAAAATNPGDSSIPLLVTDVERTRNLWLQEFAARTRAGSTDSRDWMAQASLLRQVGRVQEAVAANRRATELSPSASEAWVRLAATQLAMGDGRTAVETLERARRLVPGDPVLLSDLGAAYNELERYPDAAAVLRQSLAIAPTGDAHNNLGVALNGLQQPADAAREFERALALNRALPDAWFNLGVARAMQKAWDPARDAYERGLALAPGEPRALQNLSFIEASAGRWDQAVLRLREAVTQDPASPELRNDLGRAYLAIGARDDALRELEQGLRLDPSSAALTENIRLARETPAGRR